MQLYPTLSTYFTSSRMLLIGATPLLLVYGSKVVLSLEVLVPSLRVYFHEALANNFRVAAYMIGF